MNILVVCHHGLYQNLSASFVHAQTSAFIRLGHRVRVIVPIGIGRPDGEGHRLFPAVSHRLIDGVEVYYVRYLTLSHYGQKYRGVAAGSFNAKRAIATIRKNVHTLLKEFSPNIIHAHTIGFDSEVGAWLKRYLNLPLVVTTHGSDSSIPIEQGQYDYMRYCCDMADYMTSGSSKLANDLKKCGTSTPVQPVLYGFRLEHLAPPTQKVPFSMLQVGTLNHQKRVAVTIEAYATVHNIYPQMNLTLIGQGPDREKLEGLCHEKNISASVHFTGQIPNSEVLSAMAKFQFFCMPSVREGFGIVYLEAMASGCIVIGTEGEGVADLIENGKNGFLVPRDQPKKIAEVISWCIEHPAQAKEISGRGQRDAQSLTWEHNAQQYIDIFREVQERCFSSPY